MLGTKNMDGKLGVEGEFTLYERFWTRLQNLLATDLSKKLGVILEKELDWYEFKDFDLVDARQDNEVKNFPAGGNILIPITLTGTAQVAFDRPTSHSFELSQYEPLRLRFTKFYLSNSAQAGKTLRLLVGNGDFELDKKVTEPVDIQAQLRSEVVNTNTALGANGSYTSDSFDALNHSILTVMAFADQASATDGLKIQESIDNISWEDATEESVSANTLKRITCGISARYIRIKYTNGAVAQGTFRLMALARVI